LEVNVNENINSKIEFDTIITYDDAETFEHKKIQQAIGITPTLDQEIFTKNQNQEVIEKKVLFESNAQTDLILENIEKGDYQRAKSLIEESKESFNNIEFEENASLMMQQSTLDRRFS
jgi:hypothetical protein